MSSLSDVRTAACQILRDDETPNGAGFFVLPDGHLVTCHHVLHGYAPCAYVPQVSVRSRARHTSKSCPTRQRTSRCSRSMAFIRASNSPTTRAHTRDRVFPTERDPSSPSMSSAIEPAASSYTPSTPSASAPISPDTDPCAHAILETVPVYTRTCARRKPRAKTAYDHISAFSRAPPAAQRKSIASTASLTSTFSSAKRAPPRPETTYFTLTSTNLCPPTFLQHHRFIAAKRATSLSPARRFARPRSCELRALQKRDTDRVHFITPRVDVERACLSNLALSREIRGHGELQRPSHRMSSSTNRRSSTARPTCQ